jgi:hypothetical protein
MYPPQPERMDISAATVERAAASAIVQGRERQNGVFPGLTAASGLVSVYASSCVDVKKAFLEKG